MMKTTTLLLVAALVAVLAVAGTHAVAPQLKKTVAVTLHLTRVHSEAEIEKAFVDRSTPGSALFLEHLSQAELTELVGATPATISAVTQYLAKLSGVVSVKQLSTNDVIVAEVEEGSAAIDAFTEYGRFTAGAARMLQKPVHPVSNPPRQGLPVPAGLRAHVRMATGAVPIPKQEKKKLKGFPGMEQTPLTIAPRYKVPSTPTKPNDSTYSQAVAEFEQSYFKQEDMSVFSNEYSLPVPQIQVNGPNQISTDDIEGTLDLEYITGLNPGITTWWVSQNMSSTRPGAVDFTWWCDQLLTIAPLPSVASVSWGLGDYRYIDDKSIMSGDNDAFRKLGLRGISVMVASGDSGPGARRYLSCKKFMPSWPSSSPYITSVGATYALSADENEEAVDFSGGGFSDYFEAPSWQKSAVSNYLSTATGLPKSSFYNSTGRAYPDVSALGTNFKIYAPGQGGSSSSWMAVSGTSCASPTFAAVISRVNVVRLNKGKKTLGFLNPQLYQLGKVGFDVTSGQSVDKDCFGIFTIKGFPATTGWDAVSGLGTPDYDYLLSKLG